jgi:hypothetical protein
MVEDRRTFKEQKPRTAWSAWLNLECDWYCRKIPGSQVSGKISMDSLEILKGNGQELLSLPKSLR